MKITLSPRAEKQLRKLGKVDQLAIANKIRKLAEGTRQAGVGKLKGYRNIFRVRLDSYRIVYRQTRDQLYIILIGQRQEIYKLVKRLMS
jgi:mRNA-degrading endonuclease RelE of RelBE toxin-antitoxin system